MNKLEQGDVSIAYSFKSLEYISVVQGLVCKLAMGKRLLVHVTMGLLSALYNKNHYYMMLSRVAVEYNIIRHSSISSGVLIQ